MTNKEILQASLLDIVFDNRNKAYGAYALRRYYPNRLLIALSAALTTVILFLLSTFLFKENNSTHNPLIDDTIILRQIQIPETINEPEPQRQNNPQPQQTAQVDYQAYRIVSNTEVTEMLPTTEEVSSSLISNTTLNGQPPTDIVTINNPVQTGNTQTEIITTQPEIFSSTDPEYPGGREALVRFLESNLIVPDELELGNQKTVQVKFKINEEGKLSDIEIRKSGGESFDKEVIRVCKKMKRWKPATQNGKNVTTTFLLPVTFVAIEQ